MRREGFVTERRRRPMRVVGSLHQPTPRTCWLNPSRSAAAARPSRSARTRLLRRSRSSHILHSPSAELWRNGRISAGERPRTARPRRQAATGRDLWAAWTTSLPCAGTGEPPSSCTAPRAHLRHVTVGVGALAVLPGSYTRALWNMVTLLAVSMRVVLGRGLEPTEHRNERAAAVSGDTAPDDRPAPRQAPRPAMLEVGGVDQHPAAEDRAAPGSSVSAAPSSPPVSDSATATVPAAPRSRRTTTAASVSSSRPQTVSPSAAAAWSASACSTASVGLAGAAAKPDPDEPPPAR